ncbi:hypothetical protein IRJ41_001787 [Triplophysa rosa]|uniref:Uncharacterized protein n=1 Tax=Triplophysa rosa TaxID=992332 RepID=A0A9W7WJI1_TRIRA|nr:hypothetical protein IRJ41_001787 [Triplophysa rosa]
MNWKTAERLERCTPQPLFLTSPKRFIGNFSAAAASSYSKRRSERLPEVSVEPQPGCTDKRRKPTGRRKQAGEKHGLPDHGRKLKGEMVTLHRQLASSESLTPDLP